MEGINMTTVLKRLEAATSRLEDIVMYSEQSTSVSPGNAVMNPDQVSPRSSTQFSYEDTPPLPKNMLPITAENLAADNTGAVAAVSAVATQKNTGSPGLEALTSVGSNELAEFLKLSDAVAEGVSKQAQAVHAAYAAMLNIVSLANSSAKPELDQFVQILQPMNEHAAQVETLRDEYRKERDLANYLATVPAGVAALGWVTIEGKQQAATFVQEMRDSAQFYGNRVLKDNKEAKPWVNSYMGFLDALQKVVKEHYIEGLQWNKDGAPASALSAPDASSASSSGGAPPPPPPPPSVDQLTANLSSSTDTGNNNTGGGLSGVFAELNQGESIVSGLKPVDKKALKASKPPVPKSTKPKPGSVGSSSGSGSDSTVASRTAKLNPRVELVESKWHIEDLDDRHDVEITASMDQSVQIDNCRNCTIKILGKAATFNLSRSHKVGLLVETMVASCDIVNASNFGLQVTGTVPSLMIDQSSQGSIYLSEESLGVDIFTSQTTAININIPEGEPGAYREVPLGEQIVHNVVNGNVRSSVVKHG